ncbi:MAG: hypothetical protein KatS3mg076_0638 [Candidatus Binatia bacterium]|nr:MAG: hypothetical protein KatS3mg076_0638 [Candidatus Binatia bacterium]
MATVITSECINCGACEPECPNTAIYPGGVEWELDGQKHPPLREDIFYIVPDKCTECVGFYDHEACAAVCPVDCCVPDPEHPETEEQLIAKAKRLHPDVEFPEDFPSRFKKGNGAARPAPAEAPAPSAAQEKREVAAAPKPAAPAQPTGVAAAAAVAASPAPARIEKPISAPKPKLQLVSAPPPRAAQGVLSEPFEEALEALGDPGRPSRRRFVRWAAALLLPVLGALPARQKEALERAVGDRRFFSAAAATGLNVIHDIVLYPVLFAVAGALYLGRDLFSSQLHGLVLLGLVAAAVETCWRLREAVFQGRPVGETPLRASFYGAVLGALLAPVFRLAFADAAEKRGAVGVDGFHGSEFEDKIERERRYGEVYVLREHANGYYFRMELPRRIPPSAEKLALGVPDEMPDYKLDLALENGYFVVRGKVVDPTVRRLAAVSPAFPPDFTTYVKLERPVRGFQHRYRDKTLEVVLLAADAR